MRIAQPTSQLFDQNDCRKYPFTTQISRLNLWPQDLEAGLSLQLPEGPLLVVQEVRASA